MNPKSSFDPKNFKPGSLLKVRWKVSCWRSTDFKNVATLDENSIIMFTGETRAFLGLCDLFYECISSSGIICVYPDSLGLIT